MFQVCSMLPSIAFFYPTELRRSGRHTDLIQRSRSTTLKQPIWPYYVQVLLLKRLSSAAFSTLGMVGVALVHLQLDQLSQRGDRGDAHVRLAG
jgi:hypothetical protein